MNDKEAQQAQTIAEIRERHSSTQEGIELGTMRVGMPTAIVAHNDRKFLLEIVDSQAQKIAEQAQTIEINAAYAIELQGKIAEQAKEIERLKKALSTAEWHGEPEQTTDSKEVKL